MSIDDNFPFEQTRHVRDTCLCLHVRQAARALARHIDEVFRPLGLTNGQFSLLMSLNRPSPPVMGEVAALLAMDRTTLTAALKALKRRGLVEVRADERDRRGRRLHMTPGGRALLGKAYPLWVAAHGEIDEVLGRAGADRVRRDLTRIVQHLDSGRRSAA